MKRRFNTEHTEDTDGTEKILEKVLHSLIFFEGVTDPSPPAAYGGVREVMSDKCRVKSKRCYMRTQYIASVQQG